MIRIFAIYSMIILGLFVYTTHEGYAVSSLFGNHHHGKPGEHHTTYYHK